MQIYCNWSDALASCVAPFWNFSARKRNVIFYKIVAWNERSNESGARNRSRTLAHSVTIPRVRPSNPGPPGPGGLWEEKREGRKEGRARRLSVCLRIIIFGRNIVADRWADVAYFPRE